MGGGGPYFFPPLAKGVPEFQQAGADTAPVVPTERFLSDRLPRVAREDPVVVEGCHEVIPRRARMSLGGGGCYIRVAPGGVGHNCFRLALVRSVPVEEGQQGALLDGLPPHLQPVAAVQLLA